MARQSLFRGTFYVVEEANGFYTVHAGERQTEEGIVRDVVYPNLTWEEVETLLFAKLEDWTAARTERHQVVLASPWVQLRLLE
jgi:hypothetical protein